MYMRKWTFRQFEWHRDNMIILPSQANALFETDFLYIKRLSHQLAHPVKGIREFFLTDSNRGLAYIPEATAVKYYELLNH